MQVKAIYDCLSAKYMVYESSLLVVSRMVRKEVGKDDTVLSSEWTLIIVK